MSKRPRYRLSEEEIKSVTKRPKAQKVRKSNSACAKLSPVVIQDMMKKSSIQARKYIKIKQDIILTSSGMVRKGEPVVKVVTNRRTREWFIITMPRYKPAR